MAGETTKTIIQDKYGMNAQHKNAYFGLQFLVYIPWNKMEREN